MEPNNFNHYNNIAVIYMKNNDFINAKKNLIIAKNLKNDDENVNYNLNQVEKYIKYDN